MLSARAVNWLPFPVALKMSTFFFLWIFFKLHIFIYFILYKTFAEVMNPQLLLHLWFKMGTLCVIWQARDHWNIPIQIQTQNFQFKGGFLCNYNKNELLLSPNDSMKVPFLCRSSSASWGWAWLLCHGSAPAICHLFHTVQSSPFWPPRPVAQWSRWCGKSLLIYNENTP